MNRARAVIALGAALLLSMSPARAQESRACVSAYDLSQQLRQQARLIEARDALIRCSQPSCPPAAQQDCARWLDDVEESIPSVAVVVRDEHGQEATNAEVSIDGHPFALDGRAVSIDPGVHVIRVVRSGGAVRERRLTAVQGRKNQIVDVSFEAMPAPAPTPTGPGSPPPPPPPPVDVTAKTAVDRPVPALTYVLGSVALAGAATFAGFGTVATNDERNLRATCQPVCDPDAVSAVRRLQIVADVSLGVAVGAAAGALWTYLARPARAGRADLALRPMLGGALVLVGARF